MQTALIQKFVPGASYMSHVQLTGDANTYPTGGFALTPSMFNFVDSIDFVLPFSQAPNSGELEPEWVPPTIAGTGGNLRLIVSSTGSELGNGGNSSGAIFDLYAFGR